MSVSNAAMGPDVNVLRLDVVAGSLLTARRGGALRGSARGAVSISRTALGGPMAPQLMRAAAPVFAGHEVFATIRKDQAVTPTNETAAQRNFIASPFAGAA